MTDAASAVARHHHQRLYSLEVGRGIAALLVVLHHSGSIIAEPRFFGTEPFDGLFRNFNVGVDFFFVLSGFIISWVHWDDLGQPARLRHYFKKRFLRIYPAYWAILLPLIALYLVFPSKNAALNRDLGHILNSIILIPSPIHPILGVAWTLTYELVFYLIFAAFIALGRRWLPLLGLWAVAIVLVHLIHGPPASFPLSFILSPLNLEFVAGVTIAAALRHHRLITPSLFVVIGVGSFAGFLLFAPHIQDDALVGRLAFGGSAALIIAACVDWERRRPRQWPAAAALLGAASYAIYLIHPLALSALNQVARRLAWADQLSVESAALIMAILAAIAGIAYHITVEKPLNRLLSRWVT